MEFLKRVNKQGYVVTLDLIDSYSNDFKCWRVTMHLPDVMKLILREFAFNDSVKAKEFFKETEIEVWIR